MKGQDRCLVGQDPAPFTLQELSAPLRVTQDKEALPPAGTATQPGTASLLI